MQKAAALLLIFLSSSCLAIDNANVPKAAVEKSQLTLAGSKPFHLKAITYEVTNPKNEGYKAEIEEWWAAPDRWKRVIRSNSFTSTQIVNGELHSQVVSGTYEPLWLASFIDALFQPDKYLANVDLTKSSDNPVFGTSQLCRRFDYHVGIPPIHNRVFASYCFQDGLIYSIQTPTFDATYLEYKKYQGKQVARRLEHYVKPGETAGAKIVELSDLQEQPGLFEVTSPNPDFVIAMVSEEELRKLAPANQDIDWPAVVDGKQRGSLSVLVSVDVKGEIGELSDLNSDNPNMSDAVDRQVSTWKFKRATVKGRPVQFQGILTYEFDLTSGKTPPLGNASPPSTQKN
jgi:hypothetical protein